MTLKKMTLTLRVEVPLDESMLDVAGFRSLWEEIDGLADTCRGFGELTHFSVEDLPDRIVLADTRSEYIDHSSEELAAQAVVKYLQEQDVGNLTNGSIDHVRHALLKHRRREL